MDELTKPEAKPVGAFSDMLNPLDVMSILELIEELALRQNPLQTIADVKLLWAQKTRMDQKQFSVHGLVEKGANPDARAVAKALARTTALLDYALEDPQLGPRVVSLIAKLPF